MWCSTISTVWPPPVHRPISSTSAGTSSADDPGHRLVEQQHPRVAGQQQGDLQLALLAVESVPGGRVRACGEADPLERRVGALERLA